MIICIWIELITRCYWPGPRRGRRRRADVGAPPAPTLASPASVPPPQRPPRGRCASRHASLDLGLPWSALVQPPLGRPRASAAVVASQGEPAVRVARGSGRTRSPPCWWRRRHPRRWGAPGAGRVASLLLCCMFGGRNV
jgi:hypothetical protein